ncbi:unnamed protein product [Miscanthus lutarioriparius]|uniref:F-box domain-containing protein n=1 Tax=Miscanthus lutarioriparius TaxID=422564 RepID=A0A811Q7A7_9POAL|nr:unnamed protein product [Miscanthus lutarioriparius]
MLRKLFGWLAKSTNAPSLGSPRDVDVVDTWASLPTDLLLEIVLRMEDTTVVRCACVCKPWRRAIIGNAASLRRRPHHDRFDPSLLLGVFHVNSDETWLRRTPDPSPFQSALPSNGSGGHETVESFVPAASASAAGAIRGLYSELLSSRDGYILLKARIVDRLCLCNPITGVCTFFHPPAPYADCVYVLLTTGHDDLSPSGAAMNDDLAVRILAVKRTYNSVSNEETERLTYQVFSTSGSGDGTAGMWGPVKRSLGEMEQAVCPWIGRRSTLVSRGAVYWLAGRGDRLIF